MNTTALSTQKQILAKATKDIRTQLAISRKLVIEHNARILALQQRVDGLALGNEIQRAAILKKDDEIRRLLDRVAYLEADRHHLTSSLRILVREADVDSGRAHLVELPRRPIEIKSTPPAPQAEAYQGLAAWLPKEQAK